MSPITDSLTETLHDLALFHAVTSRYKHPFQFNSSSFQYLVPLRVACSASPLWVNW